MSIYVILTAYNMGPSATEADFDAWYSFVCRNIDAAMGFDVQTVDQYPFANGADRDDVRGGTEEQCEAIRSWLSHDGWDAFCAEQDAKAV